MEAFTPPPPEMLMQIHLEQRAKERYHVELSEDDAANMAAQVRDQRAMFLCRKPGKTRIKVWLVWWPSQQRIVPVYYDNRHGRVATILPKPGKRVEELVRSLMREDPTP
jgi:hypothetical protein